MAGPTLVNEGQINLGGTLSLSSGALTNNAGATIDFQGSGKLGGQGSTFTNLGTIANSAAGTAIISNQIAFSNQGGTFDVTAGTLVIDGYGGTSTGATFNVSPGAQVDIDGNETWGGTITGSGGGSVVIDSDAFTSINADGATFNFPTGMLNWVTGTITGSFTNLGDLTISSTANNTVNASNTLDNSGTIEINGQLNLGNLNNQAGGTITLEGSAVISGGNSSTFNNQGTLDKVGAGTASINVGNFNDLAAPINVSAGTLVDNSGGTSTGATFTVAAGAEVDLTYTSSWTGNYAGSGGGNVVLEPVTFANLTFNGATLNFPAGMLEWPTGTLAGNFTNLGSVIIPGTGSVTLNGSLTNQGTIDLAGDSSINGGASQLLVNAGLLEKTAGTGLAAINVSFNNQGATMEVDSGTLSLAGGGTDGGGTFDVAAGATLDLTGNSEPTLTGTYTGSGGGTVVLSGGVVFIGIGGATLNFPAGMLQWTGTLISSALGDLTNLGTMTLVGSSDHGFIQGGTLYDFGSIIQAGSGNLALHATTLQVEPGASYLIEADSGIDIPEMGTSALINQGTIEKTGGTGTSTILIDGTIDNSGTIEAASGTLALSGSIAGFQWHAHGGHLGRHGRRDPVLPHWYEHHRQRGECHHRRPGRRHRGHPGAVNQRRYLGGFGRGELQRGRRSQQHRQPDPRTR